MYIISIRQRGRRVLETVPTVYVVNGLKHEERPVAVVGDYGLMRKKKKIMSVLCKIQDGGYNGGESTHKGHLSVRKGVGG